MVEVFKTNVADQKQAQEFLSLLSKKYPLYKINFDLEDCDRILRAEGKDIDTEKIIEIFNSKSFHCEVLM